MSTMKIGIDGSRAFKKERTGVEEYAYCLIRELALLWPTQEVVLYLKEDQEKQIDFPLPSKWRVKIIPFKNLWTQVGLSWEMLVSPPDRLFAPAHVVPFIHPLAIMTVHGLEYEHSPQSYSAYSRWLHRFLVKNGCFWAKKIIAVSEKTKKDLMHLYQIPESKIQVVHNGFSFFAGKTSAKKPAQPYLFFVGRIEQRKNVATVIRVFEKLKEKYAYPGKLILAGKFGFGHEKIQKQIENSLFSQEIEERGFVSEEEKWTLMQNADAMLYPSFSEGFGLPILEAQKAGVPIVASDIPSSWEVAGSSEFLFPSEDVEGMADFLQKILTNQNFKNQIITHGQKNIQRFSWKKCAQEAAGVILGEI